MDEVRTETEVVYFPMGSPDRTRKAKDLEDARRICRELTAHNPLIQQRTITATPWRVVENHAAPLDGLEGN